MRCDRVVFRGKGYQVGDIVGLTDMEDDKMYYAQIRGFLQDQYTDLYACITWLLPSTSSPETGFDAATFYRGPDEDVPRKLECMEFICHAPSGYYRDPNSPYPTQDMKPDIGFIWTQKDRGIAMKLEDCEKICSSWRFANVSQNNDDDDDDDDQVDEYEENRKKMDSVRIGESYVSPFFRETKK